jgi:uroporphyrinogen-III synthase
VYKPALCRHAKRITSIPLPSPRPPTTVSPYFAIAEKYGIQVDFEFIEVQPVSYKDFGAKKINILTYGGYTSRNAALTILSHRQEAKKCPLR